MSLGHLAPTRFNLLRTERRLARVRKGAGLLRHKREALVTELFRLARPAADARQQIDASARLGYARLLRALAIHGRAGLRSMGWPERDPRVEMTSSVVWGVPVAALHARPTLRRTADARGLATGAAGPTTVLAAEEFERLAELLFDAATREMLLRRLGEALARTSRQVHTLERRVGPSLAGEANRVRRALEEREREEHLRLKHLTRRSPG